MQLAPTQRSANSFVKEVFAFLDKEYQVPGLPSIRNIFFLYASTPG